MIAAMMNGFSAELVEIEKEAGIGKLLTGVALAGTLAAGGAKASGKLMKAKPAITQNIGRASARPLMRPMGSTAGQFADKDVAEAMSFR